RQMNVRGAAGLNRAAWDLRYDPPKVVALRTTPKENPHVWDEPRFANRDTRPITHWGIEGAQNAAPIAAPGKYSVKLTANGQTMTQPFDVLKDPAIPSSDADLVAATKMQIRVRDDMSLASDLTNRVEVVRRQGEDLLKANRGKDDIEKPLNDLDAKLLGAELQLITHSDMQSDDKYYPEQYRVYMNLIWFNGVIGMGAGDVSGGAEYKPTNAAVEGLAEIERDLPAGKAAAGTGRSPDPPALHKAMAGENAGVKGGLPRRVPELSNGAADGLEIRHRHLLVLAGGDDAAGAGGRGPHHALIDGLGIVGSAAGQVEADPGIDPRLSLGARDAARRLARDVLGRAGRRRRLVVGDVEALVVAEERVVQGDGVPEGHVAQDAALLVRDPRVHTRRRDGVVHDDLEVVGPRRHLGVAHRGAREDVHARRPVIDVPADLRGRLDLLDRVVHPLHDFLAREAVLVFPGEDFGGADQDAEELGVGAVGGTRAAAAQALHVGERVGEALARAVGIDPVRLAAGDAEVAEARGRVVVAALDHPCERTGALGAPLEAVELVAAEEIFDRRVPERAVLGMVPARRGRRGALHVLRRDRGGVLHLARSRFEDAGVDLHPPGTRRRDHLGEEIPVRVLEARVH